MPAPRTILVYDEEPNLRSTLSLIFSRAGHAVTVAPTPAIAWQYLSDCEFDLVFLGISAKTRRPLSRLSELHRKYPQMPVLILCSYANIEQARTAVRQGACGYLLKPIDPELILARIDELMHSDAPVVGNINSTLAENMSIAEMAPSPNYLVKGPFVINLSDNSLIFGTKPVSVPSRVFPYLVTLARHAPESVPLTDLALESEPALLSMENMAPVIRKRIHMLRLACEPDPRQPRYIVTARGVGYYLRI